MDKESEERKARFNAVMQMAASLIEEMEGVDYCLYATRKASDVDSKQCVLFTNLRMLSDETGEPRSPSIGMLVDLLVEVKMELTADQIKKSNSFLVIRTSGSGAKQ